MGGPSDLKSNQALKPQRKYGSQMSPVERCGCRPHPWNHKSERHIHEVNERQHTLQKSRRLHDGLPPGFSEIHSQRSLTYYSCWQTPSIIFHTVRTNSSRQSRTQNRRSRTRGSKNSGNSVESQKDRFKRSSLHFYRRGGVDESRAN